MFLLQLLLMLIQNECNNAFQISSFIATRRSNPELTTSSVVTKKTTTRRSTARVVVPLHALTERQLQFWEDVEDGIDAMEKSQKDKESLQRIRQFCQIAQGKESYPKEGYGPGHEPCEEFIPGLTAKPFWDATEDPTLFPWAVALEENANIILDEFDRQQEKQQQNSGFAADSVWQNQIMGNGWSAIRLQRLGEWNLDTCRQFPKTYQLLKSLDIPLAVRGVCFARQQPGSGVKPHSDGRNFILTSHLGLSIPEKQTEDAENNDQDSSSSFSCWIQSGTERRTWQRGKLTTLDTSFLHSTGNPTTQNRDVLILDFWHPELTRVEQEALEFIYSLRNRFERGEVPVRTPRSVLEQENGLGKLWNSLFSG